MKNIKLFNMIFPIWFLLFFPPFILATLVGNFVIDSLVIIACFFVFKLSSNEMKLKDFYKKSIFKVWTFGFLADFLGALIIFLSTCLDHLGLPDEIVTAICYDPFSSIIAVIVILLAMIVSSVFIFLFNYKNTFKTERYDKIPKFKISLTIAIITIPWTFLVPTKWFY